MSQARPDGAAATAQPRADDAPCERLRSDKARAEKIHGMYEAGCPVKDISAATGLSVGAVYYWLDRSIGTDGRPQLAPQRRRHRRMRDVRDRRRLLVDRLWRAAERQVTDIETRLDALGGVPGESERDARALAVLARVLRELSALETADAAAPAGSEPHEDDGEGPYDLDTFRRELTQRLEGLRERGGDREAP